MLTKNVWQSKGLYNGSLGIVRGIVFSHRVATEQPTCLLIEFDDYCGPAMIPKLNDVSLKMMTCTPMLGHSNSSPRASRGTISGVDETVGSPLVIPLLLSLVSMALTVHAIREQSGFEAHGD